MRGRRFTLLTDHEPIRYLQTKPNVTGRQFRWLDALQEHQFEVQTVPGSKHIVPDALSRRPDHIPAVALKGLSLQDPAFPDRIKRAYTEDQWAMKLLACLRDGEEPEYRKVSTQQANYAYDDSFIHWTGSGRKKVYVPNISRLRLEMIKHFHNTGHLRIDKIFNSCTRQAFWPKMYEDVRKYVKGCQECQAKKKRNSLPSGELCPLAIPEKYWDVVTTDFLTELPTSANGHDAALVIVDKLSKRGIFSALKKTASAQDAAQLFRERLFTNHGVPLEIVSDRDPKFTANYWQCVMELVDVRRNMETRGHLQTDGQSENMIPTLSAMVRGSIQRCPKEWDKALSGFEFE